MKNAGKSLVLTSALLFSPLSFAFMCPTTFNQIDFGNTVAQVEQLCGPPAKKELTDGPDTSPQEWNYYLPQQNNYNPNGNAQGTLKSTIALDSQGRVVNITVNGISVSSMNNCGSVISIGDSRQAVESACGKPGFINKTSPTGSTAAIQAAEDANKQVELTYNSSPPVTLIFRQGVLAEKR